MTEKLQNIEFVYQPIIEIEVVTDIRVIPQPNGVWDFVVEKKHLRILGEVVVGEGR